MEDGGRGCSGDRLPRLLLSPSLPFCFYFIRMKRQKQFPGHVVEASVQLHSCPGKRSWRSGKVETAGEKNKPEILQVEKAQRMPLGHMANAGEEGSDRNEPKKLKIIQSDQTPV